MLEGEGGFLKKNSDNVVKWDIDISIIDVLLTQSKENCTGISILKIAENEMSEFEDNSLTLPTFQSILKVQNMRWCTITRIIIAARCLTCILFVSQNHWSQYINNQIKIETDVIFQDILGKNLWYILWWRCF